MSAMVLGLWIGRFLAQLSFNDFENRMVRLEFLLEAALCGIEMLARELRLGLDMQPGEIEVHVSGRDW